MIWHFMAALLIATSAGIVVANLGFPPKIFVPLFGGLFLFLFVFCRINAFYYKPLEKFYKGKNNP